MLAAAKASDGGGRFSSGCFISEGWLRMDLMGLFKLQKKRDRERMVEQRSVNADKSHVSGGMEFSIPHARIVREKACVLNMRGGISSISVPHNH